MSGAQGVTKQVLPSPVIHFYSMGPLNNQNLIKLIVEAVNAEKQLRPLIHSKGLLHIDVLELFRKARSSYEKIILNDHELAELQDIEYSLWKLHYKHVDEYRNEIRQCSSSKERMNSSSVQKQNMDDLLKGFKSFLSEATEFYQNLITKIRRSYGFHMELLIFNEGSFSGSIESSEIHQCQFSCHRCLVCLGDLARYKELYGRPDTPNRNWSFAATHYLNASTIWSDSGSPQNQLAVLATYLGDEFLALYHCIRSLAVKEPFPDAWDNLILLFEKNGTAHLQALSNESTFDFLKPSERSTVINRAESIEDVVLPDQAALWSLVVRMISFFYTKSRLEEFPGVFGSTVRQLEFLFSHDDASLKADLESYQHMDVARTGPFRVLQLVAVLIFTILTLSESPQLGMPKELQFDQKQELMQHAIASTFICMGRFVCRCLISNPIESSPLLPAILVFVEWLVVMLDEAQTFETDEKCEKAMDYFFGALVNLLNQLDDKGCKMKSDFITLWEDNELRGFLPVVQSHAPLDFRYERDPGSGFGDREECQVRVCRILNAGMKIVSRSNGSRKWIFYEKTGRKFYTAELKEMSGGREIEATKGGLDLKVGELQQGFSVSKKMLPPIEECEEEVNEGDQSNIDVHRNSALVEEEEVILFKPMRRYNSVPLPRNQIFSEASGFYSTVAGSCFQKTPWQDPIGEDSVTDPVTGHSAETNTGGLPSLAGPPSLSAWVLDRESISITVEKGESDSRKYGSRHTEDSTSTYLSGLSIAETGLSQQEEKVTPSSPASHLSGLSIAETGLSQQEEKVTPSSLASHFVYGFPPEGDSLIGAGYSSSTTHSRTAPYLPPVPSAPLLPDDGTWSSSDSSSYSECKDLEDMKEQHFLCASQVNSYSKVRETPASTNFDPSIPRFSYGHSPLPDRTDIVQRHYRYQEHLNIDQAHDNIWPALYSPTYLGRYHNHDHSKLAVLDQLKTPLSSNTKEHFKDPKMYPGGNDQSRDMLSYGFQRTSPYSFDAAMDLRSEQELLLQYLKAKERRLQRESELRKHL